MKKFLSLSFLMLFSGIILQAQTYQVYEPALNIPVTINGNIIKNPWVGGLNAPIFSTIDLNGDGIKDLFIFEKDGLSPDNYRYTTYINDGTPNQVSYTYAPEYISCFPTMHNWALLYDFDNDGKEDIFTYTNIGGMEVWHNDYTVQNGLSFSLYMPLIFSHYGPNYVNLYVSGVNLPALADVDNDGDMDVLTFSITGNNVEYHMNYSKDSTGLPGLSFMLKENAWGHFLLSGASNVAVLGVAKPAGENDDNIQAKANPDPIESFNSRHSGSCMIAVDFDSDEAKEVINGDLLGNNLLYLYNGGNKDSAYITWQDTTWPANNVPVNFITFPAAYNIDADNDGLKDILVTSCSANISENFNNVLFYKNTGTVTTADFTYQKNTMFQDEMIEVGAGANASLLDVNNDGLLDMLIGNYGYFSPTPPFTSGVSYYQNIGTASAPAFELVTRDYMNLYSLGLEAIYPAFGDIDGDGDDDMLLGCKDGTLQLYLNSAGAGNAPVFYMPIVGPNFLSIDVGTYSAPQIIDVDRDGRNDFIIGERDGNLNYYRNTTSGPTLSFTLVSTTFGLVDVVKHAYSNTGYSNPVMRDINGNYELWVGSESGNIYYYVNIDNNLGGAFTLVDSMYKKISEKPRLTLAFADINNDGMTDIFTGNQEGGVKFYYQKTSAAGIPVTEADNWLNLYPNPATDQLLVKFNVVGSDKKIEIFDLPGNLVYRSMESGIQRRIDISNLANGMYLLKVTGENKTLNKKFIISR